MKKTIVFTFFIFFYVNCFSQNIDINLLKDININRNKNLDKSFKFITNTATPLSFAIPLGVFATGLIRKEKELINKGYVTGASVILAASITTTLKYVINRKRPYLSYPEIDKQAKEGSPSFPSGHTTVAFAAATSLSLNFPKAYVIVPAYIWAGSVAYSRMHLGVHYPSDVLAGIVIGVGSSFLCYKAQNWFINKK
ncbi:MAG: phosphatase PAP2 family protein [Bacteroidetes bacterium]|nr:phosphatase PAP2 family protein [Bacteroidota bacterium]